MFQLIEFLGSIMKDDVSGVRSECVQWCTVMYSVVTLLRHPLLHWLLVTIATGSILVSCSPPSGVM